MFLPGLVDRHAVEAGHVHWPHIGVRVEAGRIDQHVDRDMRPIRHDDAVGLDMVDMALDDMRVGKLHRLVIIPVGFRNPGAAEIVVGRQLLLQLGVLDVGEIRAILALHRLALLPGIQPPSVTFVDHLPQPALLALITAGQAQLQPFAPGRIRVVPDVHPLRAPDELRHIAAGPSQCLRDLDAARAAADDPPAPSLIRHAVIPARRMKGRAGKAVATGDVRQLRLVQKAGGADEDVSDVAGAARGVDLPAPVAELRCGDFLVEADEIGEAAAARNLGDVGLDFGGWSVFARPVVIWVEWELVLAREHIDEEAGEGVVAPGAADLACLFVDGEVNAGALQGLGHEQAGDARAGDNDAKSRVSHHASLPFISALLPRADPSLS